MLEPNTYAILGEHISGENKATGEFDLDKNVNIFYQDGVLGGDHAHYDGKRYIDITGNTFVKNRSGDTVLYAQSVRFDEFTQKATLIRGRGESTQGVEQGKLHFAGTTMVTDRAGVTHVERANITTCENPRGGYHIESKTLDVYPGDKAVARSAVLFLGALAILYLPIVVISLHRDEPGSRRNPGFLPIVGYSQAEGFWVKARHRVLAQRLLLRLLPRRRVHAHRARASATSGRCGARTAGGRPTSTTTGSTTRRPVRTTRT